MKTAAFFVEVAKQHGWVDPTNMTFEEYARASDLWYRLYKVHDWMQHFRAATRKPHPNKISVQRMESFSNAYALAKLRGEI